MSATLSPVPKLQFFDANGAPLVGGKLYSYTAGTTSPLATYVDSAGTTTNTNPVILDSRGEANVWLGAATYKLALYSATNVLIWTVDDITDTLAVLAASGGSALVGFLPAGTGAVTTTVQTKLRESVSVKDFGADPTASASVNTAAIQAAADYCESTGALLQGAPGTYSTNGTITLNCSGDLSEMTISCPGATVSPAVRVGKTTGGQSGLRLLLKLPKVNNSSKTVPGWSGFDSAIGVDIANLYFSEITIPRVFGFGINLYVGGYNSTGNAYNNFHILQLVDGKVNLKLGGRDANSWSNENNYFCGAFARSSSEGTSPITGAYSIWLDGVTGTGVNNNVFYKPSVETDSDEFQFNFADAQNNTVINPRFEVTGGGRVRFFSSISGDTSDNVFIGGYQSAGINYTFAGSTSPQNKYYGSRTGDSLDFTGNGVAIVNRTSAGSTAPHLQGFGPGQNALGKSSASTDWTYRLYADGMQFKRSGESFQRLEFDGNGSNIWIGDGTGTPTRGFTIVGSSALVLTAPSSGVVRTSTDNSTSIGNASFRWSVVYAGTGTINTSDEREKQDIADLDAAEKRVATALKRMVKKFRFKDAVQAKGNNARIHVGVIAQEVIAAFEAEGLDANRYAIVCYDEWDAADEILSEEGNVISPAREAGNRYGVRYEELLAFIISAL